jgi:hypothetical protein
MAEEFVDSCGELFLIGRRIHHETLQQVPKFLFGQLLWFVAHVAALANHFDEVLKQSAI